MRTLLELDSKQQHFHDYICRCKVQTIKRQPLKLVVSAHRLVARSAPHISSDLHLRCNCNLILWYFYLCTLVFGVAQIPTICLSLVPVLAGCQPSKQHNQNSRARRKPKMCQVIPLRRAPQMLQWNLICYSQCRSINNRSERDRYDETFYLPSSAQPICKVCFFCPNNSTAARTHSCQVLRRWRNMIQSTTSPIMSSGHFAAASRLTAILANLDWAIQWPSHGISWLNLLKRKHLK